MFGDIRQRFEALANDSFCSHRRFPSSSSKGCLAGFGDFASLQFSTVCIDFSPIIDFFNLLKRRIVRNRPRNCISLSRPGKNPSTSILSKRRRNFWTTSTILIFSKSVLQLCLSMELTNRSRCFEGSKKDGRLILNYDFFHHSVKQPIPYITKNVNSRVYKECVY